MGERTLIVEYRNSRPIELTTLTASLAAVGDQFKRFVANHGGIDPETRLFVHEIRPGSIIAELVELGKIADDLWQARDYIAPFVPMLAETVETILHLKPEAKALDKPTIRNIANIVAPIAIDNGASLNIFDNRGGTVNLFVTPPDAATILHNAQHLLNAEFPEEVRFANEPMGLFQMRNAPPGKTGDYGIIDRFAPSAQKLTFASDAVKDAILHHEGNPFETIFWIDGVVKTTGGKVVGYLITRLIDATPGTA